MDENYEYLGQLFPEEGTPLCDDLFFFSRGANSLARGASPICSVEKVSIWDSAEIFSRRQQPAWLTWRRERERERFEDLGLFGTRELEVASWSGGVFGTWDFYGIMFAVLEPLLLCTLYRGYFFFFLWFLFFFSWDCKEKWWKV